MLFGRELPDMIEPEGRKSTKKMVTLQFTKCAGPVLFDIDTIGRCDISVDYSRVASVYRIVLFLAPNSNTRITRQANDRPITKS